MAEAAPAQKKEQRVLQQNRMREMEYANHTYRVIVDLGTTREHMADPAYWAHVAPFFEQYDKVIATPDDGAWYAEFLVVNCAQTWAKVREILFVDLDPKDAERPLLSVPAGYKVEWKGPVRKFCVIRTSDAALVKDGFAKSPEAAEWAATHAKG